MIKKLFKTYYNPTVFGLNNVPDNSSVILCGNHLNTLDYKLIDSVIKRNIIWLGNNESEIEQLCDKNQIIGYFPEDTINFYRLEQLRIMMLEEQINWINNNKHIRGTEKMTMVADVQREIQEILKNLVNIKTKLKNIGIDVIDYDVVLPFNNRVLKIAFKKNIPVVPFSITGDYRFMSNNLIVRFGEPFTVHNIDEDNKKLRDNVKKLIYKNY